MITLYDNLSSGNAYKVRLLLALLGIPVRRIEMDTYAGATRTPDFLAKNPNGRVPLVELEDGALLAESNAIAFYFAEGTPYWPESRIDRARVLQWMFFEQYSHEPYIAVVRSWVTHPPLTPERQAQLADKTARGYAALDVMESHLKARRYFVGERPTIADIALYAYTHVAEEGGFELGRYPAVRAWLARIAGAPGHIPITA